MVLYDIVTFFLYINRFFYFFGWEGNRKVNIQYENVKIVTVGGNTKSIIIISIKKKNRKTIVNINSVQLYTYIEFMRIIFIGHSVIFRGSKINDETSIYMRWDRTKNSRGIIRKIKYNSSRNTTENTELAGSRNNIQINNRRPEPEPRAGEEA